MYIVTHRIGLILLLSVASLPVLSEDRVLEEIVVTGERRQQILEDVSSSLGVVTNEQLARYGIDDFLGYSRSQPGVVMHQAVKNRSTFNIRGINTDIGDTQLTQEPVTVYINDMPVTQPYASLVQVDLRLYDIDRIEILRGPQGTLFGSGSLGGVVRVLTTSPDPTEFDASVRLDFANVEDAGPRTRLDGMLNIPIGDSLAVRMVGYSRREEGWVRNVNLGTENSSDDYGGRIAALWEPGERFSARLEYIYQDSNPEDGDAWNPALGKFRRDVIVTEQRKTEFSQLNLTLTYLFPGVGELLSSTNLQDTKSNWLYQAGEIPGIGKLLNQTEKYDTDYFAQELRLTSESGNRIEWIVGAFYSDIETPDIRFRFVLDGLADFANAITGSDALADDTFLAAPFSNASRESAVYGDVTYHLNDKWRFTLGGRFFSFESEYIDGGTTLFDFDSFQLLTLPGFTNKADDRDFTWRSVIAYLPDDDQHYYFNVSKGYRVGQVNPNFGPSFVDPNDVVIPPSYAPDESINFEAGAKLTMLDHRLQLNLAAYHIDWSDIQVDAVRPSDERNYIANAGDAIARGLELEVTYLAVENLDIRVAASWQDAEIDEISAQNSLLSGAREGDSLPGTADFLGSVELNYYWHFLGRHDVLTWMTAQYVGGSTNRFSQQPATGLPNPDFALNQAYTNIDVGASLMGDEWDLSVYVENLGDNDNIILDTGAVATASGENHYVTLKPRTLGVRLNYRF